MRRPRARARRARSGGTARGAAVTDAAPRAPLVATSQAGAVTESKTGIAFPAQVLSPTSGRALSLAGAGVRVKFWVVNVYAVGLYFDAAKLKGQSTSELPPVADVPALVRITLAAAALARILPDAPRR